MPRYATSIPSARIRAGASAKTRAACRTTSCPMWRRSRSAAGRLSRVARGASDPEELLLVGFFLEQLGARLERVLELRLGDEEHVLGELFLARQALAQLLQPLGVGPGGLCRRRAGGDEAYVVV